MAMDPKDDAKMKRWCELSEAGAHYPVMGVTPQEMASIKAPTIIIPGNDLTHASANGVIAHQQLKGSEGTGCLSRTSGAADPVSGLGALRGRDRARVPRFHAAQGAGDEWRGGELTRAAGARYWLRTRRHRRA